MIVFKINALVDQSVNWYNKSVINWVHIHKFVTKHYSMLLIRKVIIANIIIINLMITHTSVE